MSDIKVYALADGPGAVLVGVHGAGGMLFFGKLARNLREDQSFYLVQAEGLDKVGGTCAYHAIKELCSAYATEIRKIAGEKTVYLCGRYSPVAIETGRELAKAGVDVASLIIFDSAAPLYSEPRFGNGLFTRLVVGPVRWLLKVPPNIGLMDWLRGKAHEKVQPDPGTNTISGINRRLLTDYRVRRYAGRVVLLRSQAFTDRPGKTEKHLGTWRKITDHLEVLTVPGGHGSMFNPPNVATLGKVVQAIVDNGDPRASQVTDTQ